MGVDPFRSHIQHRVILNMTLLEFRQRTCLLNSRHTIHPYPRSPTHIGIPLVDLLFPILVPTMGIQATLRFLDALICILELNLLQVTPQMMCSFRIGTTLEMTWSKVRGMCIREAPPMVLHPVIRGFVDILIVIGMCSMTGVSMNTGNGAVTNICGLR